MATPPPETTSLEDRVKPLSLGEATAVPAAPGSNELPTVSLDTITQQKVDHLVTGANGRLSPALEDTGSLPNGRKESLVASPEHPKELGGDHINGHTSLNSEAVHSPEDHLAVAEEKKMTAEDENAVTADAQLPPMSSNEPSEQVITPAATQEDPAALVLDAEKQILPQPISPPTTAPMAESSEPQPSVSVPPTNQDQSMPDAPPLSPVKVSREREEDEDDEPAAKRTKTDEAEFKIPEVPSATTSVPEKGQEETTALSNNTPSTSMAITPLQTKFLTRTLAALKRTHDARFFRLPVDPVKLNIPSYPLIVKNPMDMHSMEDKLKSSTYKTIDEISADFKLMIDNSLAFNGSEHVVTVEGLKLQENWLRHLIKLPGPNEVEPTAAEKKAKKASTAPSKTQPARRESQVKATASKASKAGSPTTFALGPEGLPLIRRDSNAVDGRPKRSIHPPKNRDLPYSAKPKKKKFHWELKFCEEVVDELHKPKHYNFAAPFYQPVDPVALNIPTYHNIIKKPMDLSTIRTKLQTGQYENAKEMENDFRLMLKNCYKFNIPGDPTYNAGKKLEEIFDVKWSQKGRWLDAHDPSHQSDSSENEASDNEESNDDEEHEKLQALQKQIAEMSKQVEAIRQKKKKTPPVKKAGKPKSGKKDNKKVPPLKKDKRTKASRPEKQRWITFREKQVISNGISTLPENKVHDALNIIQSEVPSLAGIDQAEVELDIDELPNHVLLLLLDFVREHCPGSFEFDEPAPEPLPAPIPSKPKKNKPMNAHEQEAQIGRLAGTLSKFQGGGHSSDPAHSEEARPESSDDDDSEESEEE
ncbi:transcription initiation at TATA-containing promoter protein [Ophidiomyces ophidiicola]|nr:transcription initiation at TATA-containing promoter protein [Ophidiomyces ophidiicola]